MSSRMERMTRGDDMNPSSIREEPGVGLEVDDVEIVARELLDHNGMDWSRVKRAAYLLHQHVRYEYPAPIRDLRHRLVIVPPRVHGDQRRVLHRVDVSGALARTRPGLDEFGNHVIDVRAALHRRTPFGQGKGVIGPSSLGKISRRSGPTR